MTPGTDDGLTLGERLARQVRQLAARRSAVAPWMPALEPVLARAVSLPTAAASRLQRHEVDPAEPGTAGRGSPDEADDATPEPLPAALRERLRLLLGPEVERVRVRHDEHADRLARAHAADAVTVADQIHFRTGRFRPTEPDGAALLLHEATHVQAGLRPGSAWRRATGVGLAEEEALARGRERAWRAALGPGGGTAGGLDAGEPHAAGGVRSALLAPVARTPQLPSGQRDRVAPPRPVAASAAAGTPAARPMPAPQERGNGVDAGSTAGAVAQLALGSPEALEVLGQSLYQALLQRIRTEAERGA